MKDIQPKRKTVVSVPDPTDLEQSFQTVVQPNQAKKQVVKSTKKDPLSKRMGKTRLTIDLPDDIYEKVEAHKDETGQNFTFLITGLLRKFFDGK